MPPSGAIRNDRFANRPSASPVFSASEPITSHSPSSAAVTLRPASVASSASSRSTASWRARLVDTQLVTSGVSTISAPPAAASASISRTVARFSAGVSDDVS